jgi:aminotransferase EvaB
VKPEKVARMIPLNDLSRGISRDRDALNSAMMNVLDSGYVVMGPRHSAFESALARYLGVKHVVGLASGTDALELAMKAAMPQGRDTVLTAANAGGYSTTAAVRAGFRVQYADVDPDSLCLSSASVTSALTDETGVVVVTHLYGNFTDIERLVSLCHDRGIRVVEDCAQALGARRELGAAGTRGDVAATSFYPTKNLGAIGDGGAIMTNNPTFAARIVQLRQYGWDSKYQVVVSGGVNSRLDEVQASFLMVRLPLLDSFNERRREIVQRYTRAAEGTPIRVLPAEGQHHVAHLAVAMSTRRDEMREQLASSGVRTDIHFPIPDHEQLGFGAEPHSLPVTEMASHQVFSLPCFPELTSDEVHRVCAAIRALT